MSHGSYGSNLASEILILAGDIRSRSWPNIGGTYGILNIDQELIFYFSIFLKFSVLYLAEYQTSIIYSLKIKTFLNRAQT